MDTSIRFWVFLPLLATLGVGVSWADTDLPTNFSNQGGIMNTRHNLTQATMDGSAVIMNPYRNEYGEVCVYCHTPHGANGQLDAPLWNRTFKSNTYTTYNQLGTQSLTETVSQPGVNSLTCLSCHDGTVAIDSIINMPGSGNYSAAQQTSQNNTFLNSWTNASGPDATVHIGLTNGECLVCHSSEAGWIGSGAAAFNIAALGTDLTNDHPVGVVLPEARIGVDFIGPSVRKSTVAFYDDDGDNRPDANEIRFYKVDADYKVECASCHDPHGVRNGGSSLVPTFLRVINTNSAVCLTCHDK